MQSIGMVNDHLISCEQYQNTTRYIALLRGVSADGNNKVSMPILKEAFEQRGLKELITYIKSGNIIFSSELDVQGVQDLYQNIML